MDQDQALDYLDSIVSREKLTRQEHENANLCFSVLRELNKRFKTMVMEKDAETKAAIKKKVNPEIKPPDAKDPIDNVDRSEA